MTWNPAPAVSVTVTNLHPPTVTQHVVTGTEPRPEGTT